MFLAGSGCGVLLRTLLSGRRIFAAHQPTSLIAVYVREK
jgi:hypothetical protein